MFEIKITLTGEDEELASTTEKFANAEDAGNYFADLIADLESMGRES
jgi:hypothetical protein